MEQRMDASCACRELLLLILIIVPVTWHQSLQECYDDMFILFNPNDHVLQCVDLIFGYDKLQAQFNDVNKEE